MAGKARQDPRREKRRQWRRGERHGRTITNWRGDTTRKLTQAERRARRLLRHPPAAAATSSLLTGAHGPVDLERVERDVLRHFRMTPLARRFGAYDTEI